MRLKSTMIRITSVLICIFAMAATVVAADPDITAGPPAKASPATPGWGFYPNWIQGWSQIFAEQLSRTKQGDVGVVFIGDSLTHNWSNDGKAIWDAHFAPLKAVNGGIGGDSTRQVLWRIEHGQLDGLAPKLVVVAIGTNNLYQDYNGGSDKEVADGIKAVIDAVRTKLPQAKVLVVGMLPRQNSYFCDRITAINALTAGFDDGAAVRFLDFGARFLDAPGKVKAEFYRTDLVHLSPAGYEAYYAAMAPLFGELVK